MKPPKTLDWGHGIYFGRAKMRNGKKYLEFLNSWGDEWGDEGWGRLGEDYFGTVNYKNVLFNIWTLIDKLKDMKKLYRDTKTDKQYIEGDDKVKRWLFNPVVLEAFDAMGVIDKNNAIKVDGISGIIGKPFVIADDEVKNI